MNQFKLPMNLPTILVIGFFSLSSNASEKTAQECKNALSGDLSPKENSYWTLGKSNNLKQSFDKVFRVYVSDFKLHAKDANFEINEACENELAELKALKKSSNAKLLVDDALTKCLSNLTTLCSLPRLKLIESILKNQALPKKSFEQFVINDERSVIFEILDDIKSMNKEHEINATIRHRIKKLDGPMLKALISAAQGSENAPLFNVAANVFTQRLFGDLFEDVETGGYHALKLPSLLESKEDFEAEIAFHIGDIRPEIKQRLLQNLNGYLNQLASDPNEKKWFTSAIPHFVDSEKLSLTEALVLLVPLAIKRRQGQEAISSPADLPAHLQAVLAQNSYLEDLLFDSNSP